MKSTKNDFKKTKNTSLPSIVIVTLNWNGLKHLEYFLPMALSQTYESFSVVVVDNGSKDGSSRYIKKNYPTVEIIELNKNIGYSRGFNRGINFALENNAEYILITNNDVKLDKNFLRNGIELFRKERGIGYMSGKVYKMESPNSFHYAGGRIKGKKGLMPSRGLNELDKGQYENIEDFDFMDDVCSLVSCEMIKEVGSYDEDFFFDYEETEWNIRIRNKGYRIVYNPNMKAWHRMHGSTGGVRYKKLPYFNHWRGKTLFIYKTKRGINRLFSFVNLLFFNLPIQWGILIKHQKSSFIIINIRAVKSAFKRIIQITN